MIFHAAILNCSFSGWEINYLLSLLFIVIICFIFPGTFNSTWWLHLFNNVFLCITNYAERENTTKLLNHFIIYQISPFLFALLKGPLLMPPVWIVESSRSPIRYVESKWNPNGRWKYALTNLNSISCRAKFRN